MPLNHQDRIALDRRQPKVVELWFSLQSLRSCVSFMQTGAHPDDEISAMLAALRFRDGIALSYACAVRGEGGQNDIGPELVEDLGVLRTAEMERAADVLDLNLYWLSERPTDSIFDFGFSKDGVDTLARWDPDRVLKRLVEIVRAERPDILSPTFLDIPGQHGHHRAMTQAAHDAFEAAADPTYPVNMPVWEVSKLYLPAWSGAGGSYDDEVPPPPATLTVEVTGSDPVTGWSWERIGQMSRGYHRTQGMGRWMAPGTERNRPLHLSLSRFSGTDDAVSDGLPNIDDLGEGIGGALRDTIAAFPDGGAVLRAATVALRLVRDSHAQSDPTLQHRLARKEVELARVIRIAAGVEVFGHTATDWLQAGTMTGLTIETNQGTAEGLSVETILPEGWQADADRIGLAADAAPSDPYPPVHKPLAPRAPFISVQVTADGVSSISHLPLLVPPVVLPERRIEMSTDRAVLNLSSDQRAFHVSLAEAHPVGEPISLELPDGWVATRDGTQQTITVPDDVDEGRFVNPVRVGGAPAHVVRRIEYPHVAPRARAIPAAITVQLLNVELPNSRIGYIGGGNDRVAHWLTNIGAHVTDLSDAPLGDLSVLSDIDTLVIGIFAMRFRTGLLEAMPGINRWVSEGGTLVTLYHRPWDNWDPDAVPPKRLEIGQPSLRWRVTDENAAVTHLAPGHPLLCSPNAISAGDWGGWRKERGLYFAKSWDGAYEPLLSMADPGEAPHEGALLAANVGQGRHVHCALILHHQMNELVPGAFRIMANLLQHRAG